MNIYPQIEKKLERFKKCLQKKGITLDSMDWNEYSEIYLHSAFWNELRTLIKKRDNSKCVICHESHSLEVHHRSDHLEVLEGRKDELLVTLCSNILQVVNPQNTGR